MGPQRRRAVCSQTDAFPLGSVALCVVRTFLLLQKQKAIEQPVFINGKGKEPEADCCYTGPLFVTIPGKEKTKLTIKTYSHFIKRLFNTLQFTYICPQH